MLAPYINGAVRVSSDRNGVLRLTKDENCITRSQGDCRVGETTLGDKSSSDLSFGQANEQGGIRRMMTLLEATGKRSLERGFRLREVVESRSGGRSEECVL